MPRRIFFIISLARDIGKYCVAGNNTFGADQKVNVPQWWWLKFWVSANLLILVKIIYVEVLTQDEYSTLGISPTLKFVTITGTNFVVVLISVSTSFSFSHEKN